MNTLSERYNRLVGRRDALQADLYHVISDKERLEARLAALEKAQVLIQVTAQETQEKLRYHIEDIVQTALEACFPNEYDFVVDFNMKRGRTEADMYLLGEGGRVNPEDAAGGGLVDVMSFALRLAAWTLSGTDAVIVLDEPFKFLSENLRPLAGQILRELSEKLGLQIIMVTHDKHMVEISDKVFEIDQKHRRSYVHEK